MKYNFLIAICVYVVLGMSFSSCTKKFESYNTNPHAVTPEQLTRDYLHISGYLIQMQQKIVPVNDVNQYQFIYNLCSDNYAGYLSQTSDFGNGSSNTNTYNMLPGWTNSTFRNGYLNAMSPWTFVKDRALPDYPYAYAVAQILKVLIMHQVTDAYGPIPYTKFVRGDLSPEYDSQDIIYDAFFKELDSAVTTLNDYVANYPGSEPLTKTDLLYKGEFVKWTKLANTLRLRLAMRIVYADPTRAKAEAELAYKSGVMMGNEDNALLPVDNAATGNPLHTTAYGYSDVRMGATMESFIRGYNDPRGALLFTKVSLPNGTEPDFHGIRTGIEIADKSKYVNFSNVNVLPTTSVQIMNAAEAYFLRAEGALWGWDMGGSAKELYESGVRTSFAQNMGSSNTAAGDATSYLQSTATPANYIDPVNASNNINALSTITPAWNDADDFNTKQERIITQKWIAQFPQGPEAWSEYRRTGYPKVFPIKVNKSVGLISTDRQIRRLPFLADEYTANRENVLQAVSLLGGNDNGNTQLWWDKKSFPR